MRMTTAVSEENQSSQTIYGKVNLALKNSSRTVCVRVVKLRSLPTKQTEYATFS